MSKTTFETEYNFIDVKYYIAHFEIENIYNSDQSGFQLEFHTGRVLAQKSVSRSKKVESVTQSTCNYSYMI